MRNRMTIIRWKGNKNGRKAILDEESDPSQPSRFISEALRVASSMEQQQRNESKVAIPL
jgi:hypothetical protein